MKHQLLCLISRTVSVSPFSTFLSLSRPREEVSTHRKRSRSCARLGGGGSEQQRFAVSGQWRPPLPLPHLCLGSSPGGEKRADGPPGDRLQLQIIRDFSGFLAGLSLGGASIPRGSSSCNSAAPDPPIPLFCLFCSRGRQTAAQPLRFDKRFLPLILFLSISGPHGGPSDLSQLHHQKFDFYRAQGSDSAPTYT